jgi:cellulose synthase/poly-beta-1,6-N-acetylglucosamine synthase-like glycosyltransferase
MNTWYMIFWLAFAIVCYTYIGYGILLFLIIRIRRALGIARSFPYDLSYEPDVTLFITAYNERKQVAEKMKNTNDLDYPKNKLHVLWITDGSDDGSEDLLKHYPGIEVQHQAERNGKIGAMNRGMAFVKTPIVVFCDANAMLGRESVRRMVRFFSDPKVGCVSGEKRIIQKQKDAAAAAGESAYWKYESTLKKWDAELHSAIGAAGELFAIRTEHYELMEPDTLLDDLVISLRIAMKGYIIQYDPEAFAIEHASANIRQEIKRKIRISAGGLQSVIRLWPLLNIFKYGTLSFQYISHRVLRWTLTPICLLLMLPVNIHLALQDGDHMTGLYDTLCGLQGLFYMSAAAGWYFENRSIRIKLLFIPYYFLVMNLSLFMGCFRLLSQRQSVNWEKAERAT